MYTNMKLMFVCPAEFLLLTNQAHARADRAHNCGQVQNMTIRQQEPPQDFKLELNRCQGQSLSQLLSCQSRARSYPPFLFVSEQNSGGVLPACPSSLLDTLADRSRAPLQNAAGAQA